MVRALIENHDSWINVLLIVFSYAALIFCMLPIHEFAHALVANKLGDPTAKWHGRLTLNPLKHLDKFGTLMMLLVGFGYAKPVPVDSRYFQKPGRDLALTALAGPVSNLLMAVLSVGIFAAIQLAFPNQLKVVGGMIYYNADWILYAYIVLIEVFASVNLVLAVFNLLPIFPLDGSRIFGVFLPAKWNWKMQQYQHVISLVFLVLIFSGVLDKPLYWLQHFVGGGICHMFGLPNLF
ncbi:MAG: site-2 protease family protein [Ruminococcaceae bacterium]|nr:site-2 protease family protein [Oscillospiraceae bacterium]